MSTEVIAREAARWWLLAHEGARDEHAFQQWMQADPRNRLQYQHLLHLWEAGAQLPSIRRGQRQRQRRRGLVAGATVTALAVMVLVSAGPLQPPPGQTLQTGSGQLDEATLADGSQVRLAAQTRLRADITDAHRQLTLQQGQAWFKVAADATRPFQVRTPHGTVTALGTAFDIQVSEAASVVTVSEHRVRIEGSGTTRIAEQGQQLRFNGHDSALPGPADAGTTAWQQQRIVQIMRPVASVTAELDRWHGGHTVVIGSALRGQQVSVIGSTSEAAASRDQLARQLSVHVLTVAPGVQVWLPRNDGSP